MNNIYHKIITGGFALVLAGAVAFTAAPMDAQASAALGISSQIGLSADMDAAETTDVENAMNQTVGCLSLGRIQQSGNRDRI